MYRAIEHVIDRGYSLSAHRRGISVNIASEAKTLQSRIIVREYAQKRQKYLSQ
jgi:hypothetical protein